MSLDTENMRKTQFKILLIALLVMLLQPLAGFAITKQNADDSYHQGNYQQAISDYKELLGKGVSPALYYNLGNAYYRSDSLSKAILCYERAYKLSPSDKDIRFNLQFARSKTIDKIAPEDDNFFTLVYQSIVNFADVDTGCRRDLQHCRGLGADALLPFCFPTVAAKDGFLRECGFPLCIYLLHAFRLAAEILV